MEIRTTTAPEAGTMTVSLVGRFDAHECPTVREAFDEALAQTNTLIVDLADVVFLDSTALAELVRCSHHAAQRGVGFLLGPVSDPARVILELTGLDLAFERAPLIDAAS